MDIHPLEMLVWIEVLSKYAYILTFIWLEIIMIHDFVF